MDFPDKLAAKREIFARNGIPLPAGLHHVGADLGDLLLRAKLAAAGYRRDEPTVVIAGDGEPAYRASLDALAAEHGVADRLRFVGHVDDVRKWDLIGQARFLVLPSYSENFGVSVAEALSAGCPMILAA